MDTGVREHTIGFTGTRRGLSQAQASALWRVLREAQFVGSRFLHGACAGADEAAAEMARREHGFFVVAHPASDVAPRWRSQRALDASNRVLDARPALKRNRAIVAFSRVLVACPSSRREERRSGTWATIRRARGVEMPIVYVWPDGCVTYSDDKTRKLFERGGAR